MAESPTFTIDPVELGDIAEPKKLALEIHRQLRTQLGAVPLALPLAKIAEDVGIVGMKEFETKEFEGTLVISEGRGAIGLRKGMRSGRRNFTIGHEIGHFLIPSHRLAKVKFECSSADLKRNRSSNQKWDSIPPAQRIEIQANEFAAELLVPMPEFRAERRKLGKGADLGRLRELAKSFDVSLEMMSGVYVRDVEDLAAIIISQDRVIRRIIPATDFPYMGLRSGSPVPEAAFTRTWVGKSRPGDVSDHKEVSTSTWLEKRGRVEAIYEQTMAQANGWATTLLTIEQAEEDDEDEDRNWNRR
ncbi:ImmA/IrrE family metallo-endopeptidase [Bradyrhizobium sp. HKCCYLRH3099]|uniref:ImmA/IrrE family metallo-endopeptidase n=1 Tax=unclassified Bradyrhizobium TaxID=2631580 RepID=UPI003EB82608